MKPLLAVLTCICFLASAVFADSGYKVKYDGGSLGSLKSGTDIRMEIGPGDIRLFDKGTLLQDIPASSVTDISYGQDVHRRVGAAIGVAVVSFGLGALMALTKSKKHYVGLTWAMGTAKGGFAMQCDKNEYRGILTGLEGITGKKAVDTDAMNVKN